MTMKHRLLRPLRRRAALAAVLTGGLSTGAACQAGAQMNPTATDAAVVIAAAPSGEVIARFQVLVADDPEERARGLMWRTRLADDEGMLFVYPRAQSVSFWMRNTLIPLDMVFIAEDCRIVRIEHEAPPRTLTPRSSGAPVKTVLEIRGGLARALGVAPGDCVSWSAAESAGPPTGP